jgi:hypothetical protein
VEQLPTGHSAQYLTLARALGYAAGYMEDDIEELADVGQDVSAASLRMEARFVTVTLLAAAMAQSLANTIIAMAANEDAPQPGRWPTLFELWKERIPSAIGCAPFLTATLASDLTRLSDIRNSITHATPRLYAGDSVISDGNASRWEQLDTRTVRMFVRLPLRLLAAVPRADRYSLPLEAFADDYWLNAAIARGEGQPGRSYNMWRPESREARLKEIRDKNLT